MIGALAFIHVMGVVVDQYFVFWHSFSFFEVDSLGVKSCE
jgi:hypothetical protein